MLEELGVMLIATTQVKLAIAEDIAAAPAPVLI